MFRFRKSSLLLINAAILLSVCGCSQVSEVQNPVANTENITENTDNITENTDTATEQEPEPEPEPEPEEILPVTVTILGKEYDQAETFLDLSDMTPEDIAEVSTQIAGMPELKEVDLMPALLSLEAVSKLKEAAPDVHFMYEFDMFEQHLTTEDTEVS
ncbi:MAG: hypothetical protein J6W48_09855, partial [Lachnospiraceae bacterium]|nr:hypothetical protein [Lachnospiraceae bacterium]